MVNFVDAKNTANPVRKTCEDFWTGFGVYSLQNGKSRTASDALRRPGPLEELDACFNADLALADEDAALSYSDVSFLLRAGLIARTVPD